MSQCSNQSSIQYSWERYPLSSINRWVRLRYSRWANSFLLRSRMRWRSTTGWDPGPPVGRLHCLDQPSSHSSSPCLRSRHRSAGSISKPVWTVNSSLCSINDKLTTWAWYTSVLSRWQIWHNPRWCMRTHLCSTFFYKNEFPPSLLQHD